MSTLNDPASPLFQKEKLNKKFNEAFEIYKNSTWGSDENKNALYQMKKYMSNETEAKLVREADVPSGEAYQEADIFLHTRF